MKTAEITLSNGVIQVTRKGYKPPTLDYDKFKTFLSKDNRWSQEIITGDLFNASFAPALHIHEDCFKNSKPSYANYYQANGMLFQNVLMLINYGSKFLIDDSFLREAALEYFASVDWTGIIIYKALHGKLS